ncbi:MAG: hypothetical protein EOO14_07450 [Chitinophagaceae bacterium]|nr:MAG: hypothetical protein EOO14_07450 [Chitinophagaceae bacterium]
MQTKKRVVFYLVDGARPDILQKLLDQKQLPNLAQIIAEGTFRTATSCLPSTTGPAYLPFLTGHFPGTMNITGIRWFDKKEFKRSRLNKLAMRSYCGPEAAFFNSDMREEKGTLFEKIDKAYNVYNMVTRGLKRPNDLTPKGKGLLYTRAHFFLRHHPVDTKGHEAIMSFLNRGEDFEFLFAVFPSVDWDSHYHHFDDDRTVEAYKIADDSIGEVRRSLEKKGWWKDTLFLLTSDHGLSTTHTHFDVGDWMTKHDLRSVSYPVIWRRAPKSAVMISGNSFGSVHLLNHEGDHVLHKKEVQACLGRERLAAFVAEKAVEFMAYRADDPNSFVIQNRSDAALVRKEGDRYRYHPETGDPLRLGGAIEVTGRRAALEATFGTDFPDALVQVAQLFQSRRAGDFIVCAKNGFDLRDFWEYPEHKGSHGSLDKEHMLVPLVFNQKLQAVHPARTADLYATILHWLGQAVPPSEGTTLL